MEQRTIIKNSEEDFEILQGESNQQQQSIVPKFSSFGLYKQACQREKDPIVMDFVIEEETYIILDAVQRDKVCFQSEWKQFISRKRDERYTKNKMQHMLVLRKKGLKSRVSYIQRNTIIQIHAQDIQKRKQLWSIAQKPLEERNKQQSFINERLSLILPQNEEEALRKGVVKIQKIFKSILKEANSKHTLQNSSNLFWTKHLKVLEQNQNQIVKWTENTLIKCAFDFKQIRYCKGLQYLCLGIIFAYPELDFTKYSQIFTHFLRQLQFQQLYLQGSPRFYCQLRKITQSLKQQNSEIFQNMTQLNGDTKNLFITYYRSCLLYHLKNPELIRKLFQLLLTQGITLIKTIILRIIQKMRNMLLQGPNFLQNIASFLILHYFRQSSNEDLKQRLKSLFEM